MYSHFHPPLPNTMEFPAAVSYRYQPPFNTWIGYTYPVVPFPLTSSNVEVRSVWASNLLEEFEIIGNLIGHYNHLSIDTEFPGTIHNSSVPIFQLNSQAKYAFIKANVDDLKLIQLGLTLSDADGNLPFDHVTGKRIVWEFNFKDFNPGSDPDSHVSVELLRNSGIDIERNLVYGVGVWDFARMMITKRIVLNPNIIWITFQGAYDFAFAVKALMCSVLPTTLEEFMRLVRVFFGNNIYDVKYMMRHCNCFHGGLETVAQLLKVGRVTGKRHQAGSDSLLTLLSYMKMKKKFFQEDGGIQHAGVIFGLEVEQN